MISSCRTVAVSALSSRHGRCLSRLPPQPSTRMSYFSTTSISDGSKNWIVYLSGEIHSDWREVIAKGVADKNLPVTLTSPNTSHEDSDDCGAIILGMQEERPNWDMIGAKMNAIRTKTLLNEADVVVVRFGEKYRQWNAAFDAGYAAALGKPIITLHPPALSHMLKEVNASANTVCEDPEQVVDTLAYVIRGELPKTPRDGDTFVPIADRLGKGNPNP
ncbi:YtoQ family protein [Nitzschia inconspicua]|uniref:YtoQ family protein n=1 Tax=Nitzschia inconspicua TaxID=303405 RepID=A0A9K3LX85_9STRA|nr:YtoQ family protein [Nitzschia inconspicua]